MNDADDRGDRPGRRVRRRGVALLQVAVDVAIIRGTTADQFGNISMEHEGAYLGALDQALAARNNGGIVIAQVKRPRGGPLPRRSAFRAPWSTSSCSTRPDADDPNPLRPGDQRRDAAPMTTASHRSSGRRQGDRAARGDGVARRRGGQPRLRHLRAGAADPARGGADGRGDLGDRAGRGRRGAAARVRVRLRANAQALMPSPQQFTSFQGGGFDRTFAVVHAGRRRRQRQRLEAGGQTRTSPPALGGFIDITARARHLVFSGYFTAGGARRGRRMGG